jgi:putative ABC transport system permease protein
VTHVKTLDQLKSESMIPDRLRSALFGVFAALALARSAIGLYGVIAYAVVQRTHEIGIRAALGASSARLVAAVVGQGVRLAGVGLAVGCVAALGVTRLLRSFLFGVATSDLTTWIGAITLLAGVAVLASYIPARQAARINPLQAMRAE